MPIYAVDWPQFIIKEVSNFTNLRIYIKTKKVSALVIGPGLAISSRARRWIINCVRVGLPVVLDADAISNFANEPNKLFNETLVGNALLTPHEESLDEYSISRVVSCLVPSKQPVSQAQLSF